MNKYIDAEHFDARVREAMGMAMDDLPMEYQEAVQAILAMLKTEPAADVQEVRHGRWELYDICSVCGAQAEQQTNFCPNCGASMRGEEK